MRYHQRGATSRGLAPSVRGGGGGADEDTQRAFDTPLIPSELGGVGVDAVRWG